MSNRQYSRIDIADRFNYGHNPCAVDSSLDVQTLKVSTMKLVAGAMLLLIAEHSYSHYLMVPFPNNEHAATVLVPVSVISLLLGTLLMIWGLLTEARSARN